MDVLILGLKGQGKTTLGLLLAREYKKLGLPVAVMTPIVRDVPRWRNAGADFVTGDRAALLTMLKRPGSRGIMVFLDEAAETAQKYDKEIEVFCAKARHDGPNEGGGHTLHFICQRATMMNVNVREMCTRLYMLRQGIEDCEVLARKWGQPQLRKGHLLQPLEYMHCTNVVGSFRQGRLPKGAI
jgi:hypothetical protein